MACRAAAVGTQTAPLSASAATASASMKFPCSTLSTPAASAPRTASAPLQCTITAKPSPWAMCTSSRISAASSGAQESSPNARNVTMPENMILTKSAPSALSSAISARKSAIVS